ncbi:MAG: DUF3303 family protein [Verrucomicrobia bacterium]|nr:DUF3303 family protein [Verrucomicrobiota bacterium]MDA1086884.1 DUF3303 family protein [Verrucomicrobiota bacterium]
MLFHISYEFPPEERDDAQARFKATGAPAPDGVTMIGRWHSAAGHLGFTVAESESVVAIGKWMQEWTDLLTFEITPVLTDEEVAEVIG